VCPRVFVDVRPRRIESLLETGSVKNTWKEKYAVRVYIVFEKIQRNRRSENTEMQKIDTNTSTI